MKKIEESISMKKSLTFKLVACAALLLFSILAVVGGVWAAQSVSINTTGNITFAATNVYAKVSGSTSGAQSNKTYDTLTFSSASVDGAPVSGDATTWTANNDLAFQTTGEDVVISVTVENLSTERELYVKLKDNLSSSSANLQKTVSPSVGAVQTLGKSTGEGTSTVTYTITLHIKDQGKSVNGEFDYLFELVDGSQTKPEDDATSAAAEAYLLRDWQGAIRAVNSDFTGSKINSLSFTKGSLDGVTNGISVAASTAEGTSAKTDDSVGEILAIVTEAGMGTVMDFSTSETFEAMTYNVEIRSSSDIYAPVNSTALFFDSDFIDCNGGQPTTLGTPGDPDFNTCMINTTSLTLSNFKTDNVTKMGAMFYGIGMMGANAGTLDISSWNTSNVTNMSAMFGAAYFTAIELGTGFVTSSVTDMNGMFAGCASLTSVDISSFNTAAVTDMESMFIDCSQLTSIDVSGFDTSEVVTMRCMFSGCSSLESIDISNFETPKLNNVESMFNDCSQLTTLDVSSLSLELEQTVSVSSGFCNGCTNLTTIVAPTITGDNGLPLPEGQTWSDGETTYTYLKSATNGKTLTKVAE